MTSLFWERKNEKKGSSIRFSLSVIFTAIAGSHPYSRQNRTDRSLLTLDRIFLEREFESERFGGVKWLEDGSGYTTLEPSRTGGKGQDIVKYNAVPYLRGAGWVNRPG